MPPPPASLLAGTSPHVASLLGEETSPSVPSPSTSGSEEFEVSWPAPAEQVGGGYSTSLASSQPRTELRRAIDSTARSSSIVTTLSTSSPRSRSSAR